jgi:hypothetical protein
MVATVEYFPPLYLSRISSCKQASACRSAEQTTEGIAARHPVSQTKKLVEESCLARAKIATSTAVRQNPGCPPHRRKAAERGKMDGFDAVLLNRKKHQKTKKYSISVRGIFDEYQQIWLTIPPMSSPPDGARSKPGRDRDRCATAYLKMAQRKAQ